MTRTALMRDHTMPERPATPLELLFDLCFVVAVAFLAAELHHGITEDHTAIAVLTYLALFAPVWWAWMSYTWFATAFSHDDAITRVLTFGQMAGILAVAATIPLAADGRLAPFAVAYAAMRLPLVGQWLRSAAADRVHRAFALTYAAGAMVAQILWVAGALAGGEGRVVLLSAALVTELATPVLAVRRSPGRVFHPRHIAERYGLFTIIVLGETVLAGAVGFRQAVDSSGVDLAVLLVAGSALVICFAMWWLYFEFLGSDALERNRRAAFLWGYGHYVLFAGMAAVGAGVAADIQLITENAGAGHADAGAGTMIVALAVGCSLAALGVLRRASAAASVTPALGGFVGMMALAGATVVAAPMVVMPGIALVAVLVLMAEHRDPATPETVVRDAAPGHPDATGVSSR